MGAEMIKAVTFDIWNTLFTNRDYTNFRVNDLVGILEELDIRRNADEVRRAYILSNKQAQEVGKTENYRYVTTEEKLDHILETIQVDLSGEIKEMIVRRFKETIWSYPPSLKEGVFETLETLGHHYRLGIISDTGITPGRVVRQVLSRLGALGFFESMVFSDETGICKPHEDMFRISLRELGASPHESVHVGDLLKTDVAGAKKVGMRVIWVKTEDTGEPDDWRPDYIINSLPQVIEVLDDIDFY
jgi:putative hydrolase of the HAD superfamily